MSINKKRGVVIIAGSGMCDGGRILYHLGVNLSQKTTSVILVGFQAEDTLGRELMNGATEVKINDKRVKVNGSVKKLLGFSAHADQGDLIDFFKQYDSDKLKKLFLVHAEKVRAEDFAAEVTKVKPSLEIKMPKFKEEVEL